MFWSCESFPHEVKGEVTELLKCQACWVKRLSGCMVKKIVSHGGGEYAKASKDLEAKGIEVHLTAPYTSQQNERAKRMNLTINNGIQT